MHVHVTCTRSMHVHVHAHVHVLRTPHTCVTARPICTQACACQACACVSRPIWHKVYIIDIDLRHSVERVYMYAGMCVDASMFIVYIIYTDLCHSVKRAARRGPPIRVGVGGAKQRLG